MATCTFICCSKRDVEDRCSWNKTASLEMSEKFIEIVDSTFSDKNDVWSRIGKDTLVLIANDEDYRRFNQNDELPEFDFSENVIVVGNIEVTSSSKKISSCELFFCEKEKRYEMRVDVPDCDECWGDIAEKSFWKVYPLSVQKNNITLVKNEN